MDLNNSVMTREQLQAYVYDRKFHSVPHLRGEQIRSLQKVVLHNALKSHHVELFIKQESDACIQYDPPLSQETHFYDKNNKSIHVVNARGVTRLKRDQELTEALSYLLHKQVDFEVRHFENDPAKASKRFEEYAFEVVNEMLLHTDKRKLQNSKNAFVVMGPINSFPVSAGEVLFFKKDDYLTRRIVRVGDKEVLHFGYIFADQARNVLSQLYLNLNAYFSEMNIHLFHYGKVGILNNGLYVGDICLPQNAIDEDDLNTNYHLTNQLIKNPAYQKILQFQASTYAYAGTTVNSKSVLSQTREGLHQLQVQGADFIDMEWLLLSSMQVQKSAFPNIGKVHYYFAGVGSDKPLEGRTLGDTAYPKEKELLLGSMYKEILYGL